MEKSISNRFYFDYNATSPLALKVKDFLAKGDFLFGNPSSLHQEGKNAKRSISLARDFIYQTFSFTPSDFQLFFHSGATEGINSYFKGNALKLFQNKKKGAFFFSSIDHSAVMELKNHLELFGHHVYFFEVDKNGAFDHLALIEQMNDSKKNGRELFLNFTYINNETGVIWPLSLAEHIKEMTSCQVHVDAVQLICKKENWHILSKKLDAYTFSGHKFGSLKGVGFTFLKNHSSYEPLLTGGNQESGLRSGTQNALGIYSVKLALEEALENFDPLELKEAKSFLEMEISNLIKNRGEIVGVNALERNLNTIFVVMFGEKAELLSTKFDINGMDVSTGSACSSGIIKENRILMNMGYSKDDSRSAIRLSFSPFMKKSEAMTYFLKIKPILGKSS